MTVHLTPIINPGGSDGEIQSNSNGVFGSSPIFKLDAGNSTLKIQALAGNTGTLKLSTGELTVVDGDILGRIDFQAPLESDGGDAILVVASIYAEADGVFSASSNKTELVFATAKNGAIAEVARFTNDGRLGIGTAAPSALLDVRGGALFNEVGSDVDFRIEGNNQDHLFFLDAGLDNVGINESVPAAQLHVTTHGTGIVGQIIKATAAQTADLLRITDSADAVLVVVDSVGQVGVGTGSPVAPFEIQSTAASMRQTRYSTVASQSAGITVQRSGGSTPGTDVVVEDGWRVANFNLRGYDGAAYKPLATIEAWVDGTPGLNDMPGRLVFSTTANGSASVTERMRITQSGLVGINVSSPGAQLEIALDVNTPPTISTDTAALFTQASAIGDDVNITLIAGATGSTRIHFGDTADENIGIIDYDHNSNAMIFTTNTSEKMRIASDGKLGLGSVAPVVNFHIAETGVPTIRLSDTGAGTDQAVATLIELYRGETTNRVGFWGMSSGGSDIMKLATDYAAGEIKFATGSNVDAMTIDSSGNVGIGTTSPNEKFQVDDAIAISNDAEGSTARLTTRTSHETHTLSLAATSDTTTISIPLGARLLGVSMNVNTAVTDDAGDDRWTAAFITGSTTTIVTLAAAAQNTKVDFMVPDEITTAATQIQFTPQGGSFSAGVIEIVAYYEELTSLANV